MYFRRKTLKSGRVLQLVLSYRNAEGLPRQRVVVSLGDAGLPELLWRDVADGIEANLFGQPFFFANENPDVQRWVRNVTGRIEREGRWRPANLDNSGSGVKQDAVGRVVAEDTEVVDGVLLDQIDHTHETSLGPALLGLHAWEELGLPDLLASLGFNPVQRATAAALVLNRLEEPMSEHALGEWLPSSSFPDLLGEDLLKGAKDRLYRVGDRLLKHQLELEPHFRERQSQGHGFKRQVLLYDLTNTHFEGVCSANRKARRGANKQKRNDCPQVVIGMVFDEYGFELAHRTFSGNLRDSNSLVEMLKKLDSCVSKADWFGVAEKPLVILDSGVATEENRRLLRHHKFSYVVSHSRPGRKAWADEFSKDGFQSLPGRKAQAEIQVRTLDIKFEDIDAEEKPETVEERLVLCKSRGRRLKEEAIRSSAEDRFIEELEKLQKRIESGKLKVAAKIDQALGRLLERRSRIARFYHVERVEETDESGTRSKLKYRRKDDPYDRDDGLLGCYVLRCWGRTLSGPELWHLYMTLSTAEDAFRTLKGELGLRPNYHQLEERVDAHIFITVLAYQCLSFLLYRLRQFGDNRRWTTIRRILQPHCYSTIIVPTVDGTLYRIRKAGVPEPRQRDIYRHFNLSLSGLPRKKLVLQAAKSKPTL